MSENIYDLLDELCSIQSSYEMADGEEAKRLDLEMVKCREKIGVLVRGKADESVPPDMELRQELFDKIAAELDYAYAKHGSRPWGRHEFYAILKEEVDELWNTIKGDKSRPELIEELVQVAAMCCRYYEIPDRYGQ